MPTLREMMGLPPIEKPAPPKRRPGTDYVSTRDRRLKQKRAATAAPNVAELIAQGKITPKQVPAAIAEGAYEEERRYRAKRTRRRAPG